MLITIKKGNLRAELLYEKIKYFKQIIILIVLKTLVLLLIFELYF